MVRSGVAIMTIVYLLIEAGIFLAFIIWQEIAHKRERFDLYNRLMARDLNDYNSSGQVTPGRNFIRKALESYSNSWGGDG